MVDNLKMYFFLEQQRKFIHYIFFHSTHVSYVYHVSGIILGSRDNEVHDEEKYLCPQWSLHSMGVRRYKMKKLDK